MRRLLAPAPPSLCGDCNACAIRTVWWVVMVDVDRSQHVSFGLAERWILAGGGLVVIALAGMAWNDMRARQKSQALALAEQSDQIATLAQAQQVTNARLTMLITQLADVPQLTRNVAELDVQVNRNTTDIRELRQVRGLE